MPVTPDKLDTIIALLLDIKSSLGSTPPASNEATKFLARWAPVTDAEFQAKYGVAAGQSIPAMSAYEESEAIYRARAGYSTQGLPTAGRSQIQTLAVPAIDIIANATQETASTLYECGYGLTDPDVCACGFYYALFASKQQYQQALGSAIQPRAYAGQTLATMLAPNFAGGSPSGG